MNRRKQEQENKRKPDGPDGDCLVQADLFSYRPDEYGSTCDEMREKGLKLMND